MIPVAEVRVGTPRRIVPQRSFTCRPPMMAVPLAVELPVAALKDVVVEQLQNVLEQAGGEAESNRKRLH